MSTRVATDTGPSIEGVVVSGDRGPRWGGDSHGAISRGDPGDPLIP